jgi:hypothetical protein
MSQLIPNGHESQGAEQDHTIKTQKAHEVILMTLGYKQEFKRSAGLRLILIRLHMTDDDRDLTWFESFSISFSVLASSRQLHLPFGTTLVILARYAIFA